MTIGCLPAFRVGNGTSTFDSQHADEKLALIPPASRGTAALGVPNSVHYAMTAGSGLPEAVQMNAELGSLILPSVVGRLRAQNQASGQ